MCYTLTHTCTRCNFSVYILSHSHIHCLVHTYFLSYSLPFHIHSHTHSLSHTLSLSLSSTKSINLWTTYHQYLSRILVGAVNTVDFHYSRFYVCEFACLLKFACNPQSNIGLTFLVVCGCGQRNKQCVSFTPTFPAEVKEGQPLPSCLRSLYEQGPLELCISYFVPFVWSCLTKCPQHSAEVLSSATKSL